MNRSYPDLSMLSKTPRFSKQTPKSECQLPTGLVLREGLRHRGPAPGGAEFLGAQFMRLGLRVSGLSVGLGPYKPSTLNLGRGLGQGLGFWS